MINSFFKPAIRIFILWFILGCTAEDDNLTSGGGIKIFSENPAFWEYDGKPIFLIGGTQDDNLFQIDNLKSHLELLHSLGGNYIRCTMSSRDEGNVKPYLKNEEGLFDLTQQNPAYWDRLDSLFSYCSQLDIIAQVEIWATYDFYWGEEGWAKNVFNPLLNCNYSSESSGLPEVRDLPAQSGSSEFFRTVPQLDNTKQVLKYQQIYVDKLLSISMKYDNLLYSIDNETTAHYEWGKYWAVYLHKKAKDLGKDIYVTEMWDCWDPSGGEIEEAIVQSPSLGGWFADYQDPHIHETANFLLTFNDTLSYQFVDVANNNAQKGETHYKTALWVWKTVQNSGKIRPINNVKVYGGDRDNPGNLWAGNRQDGKERLWRNVFAGHAAVRFHRPPSGIGLNEEAQSQVKSLRMLTKEVDMFNLKPNNSLLSQREANEAFCLQNSDTGEIAIYFPGNGEVMLEGLEGTYNLLRINIPTSTLEHLPEVKLPAVISNTIGADCVFVLKKE